MKYFHCLCSIIALMALATLGLSSCRSTKSMTDTSEKIDTTAFSSSSSSSSESQSTALRYSLSLDSLFLVYLFDDTDAGSTRTTSLPTATLQEDSCGSAAIGHPVPVSTLGSLIGQTGTNGGINRPKLPSGTRGVMIGAYGLSIGKDSIGTNSSSALISSEDSNRFNGTKEMSDSKEKKGTVFSGMIFSFILGAGIIIGTWLFLHRR